MTVSITASNVLGGTALADSLQGGGSGYQFGTTEAGVTPSNKLIYLRHDGSTFITNLSLYVKSYSQTYGGEYSASSDYAKVVEQGGLGSGFQIDFDWDGVAFATFSTITSGVGVSPETAIGIPVSSIFQRNGGSPIAATAPVSEKLGASGDTTFGDTVLLKTRWLVPSNETQPGRRQIDLAFIYNFTT